MSRWIVSDGKVTCYWCGFEFVRRAGIQGEKIADDVMDRHEVTCVRPAPYRPVPADIRRGMIAFARSTWRGDGAEDDTVRRLCCELEEAHRTIARMRANTVSMEKWQEAVVAHEELRRQRDELEERLRIEHECCVCHGALLLPNRPPHCEYCAPDEDELIEWEERVRAWEKEEQNGNRDEGRAESTDRRPDRTGRCSGAEERGAEKDESKTRAREGTGAVDP